MPFYRFSTSSSAIDDGYSVIAPNVGSGRWLLLRSDVGAETVAALAAIPPQQRSPNLPVYVAGANSWYSFKSGPATLPSDVTPIIGAGSWELNTEIVEVVPPYKKTFNLQDTISRSDQVDFAIIQTLLIEYRELSSRSERVTVTIGPPSQTSHREAVAHADRVGFTIVSGSSWKGLTANDWLNLTASAWLDQSV